MAAILTPLSLWRDFDDGLDVTPIILGEKTENGIKYEYVNFPGRETGGGRVTVYGVVAQSAVNPSKDGVLIIPDSYATVDEGVLRLFADKGYTALMVDIRGKYPNTDRFTVYPENVAYANFFQESREKNFVDDSAQKTSWYEWVAVGLYARKFLAQTLGSDNIGVVGIRDGGEVAWKLASAGDFRCAVPVCACGWKAYDGYSKFGDGEPDLDEERYRFIAGIDSQSYAPYVKCPVLMLCSTNEERFDYDRAYDTFSRINPEYFNESAICYSINSNVCLDASCTNDMFMFLDSHVKNRHVFIPKPAEIGVTVDGDDCLVARASFDAEGVAESFGMYIAGDCKHHASRDWSVARYKGEISRNEHEFYLDVYEKTALLFAICYVKYSNGFTVWSKIIVKKISGQFRNSRPKSKVMYTSKNGVDCFSLAYPLDGSIGGTFFVNDDAFPKILEKDGLKGIYSPCGLRTFRLNAPKYAPDKDSVLKFDIYPDGDMTFLLYMTSADGDTYIAEVSVVGGVWQSVLLKSKQFKTSNGIALADFTQGLCLTVGKAGGYAINNVMWL